MGVSLAVYGATGQVGTVMRRILLDRAFPVDRIRFLASARSAGKRLPWKDGEIEVEPRRIQDGYSVVASRLDPVGVVYLWPVTG